MNELKTTLEIFFLTSLVFFIFIIYTNYNFKQLEIETSLQGRQSFFPIFFFSVYTFTLYLTVLYYLTPPPPDRQYALLNIVDPAVILKKSSIAL